MTHYNTLSEAVEGLKQRGYRKNFNLLAQAIQDKEVNQEYGPDQFLVEELHRFEGMSSTGDSSVVYAIKTEKGDKGLLVDAYGAYAESVSPEIVQRLERKN
jgi:hypothetical protein